MEHHRPVPYGVLLAIERRDTRALTAMAKAGARKRNENRDKDEAFKAIIAEKQEREEWERAKSAGEHIIPLSTYDE